MAWQGHNGRIRDILGRNWKYNVPIQQLPQKVIATICYELFNIVIFHESN